MSQYAIQQPEARKLVQLVEESTRATGESVKYFIEPSGGVLDKAKSKRNHIIFGRRGSGKSSLLQKVTSDLTVNRTPRLVLASGGVARDFLNIFRQSVEATNERIVRGELTRGPRIGTEDVNKAAGDQGQFKEEDFTRDTSHDDQSALRNVLEKITEFCISKAGANCILVEKDTADQATVGHINELVDLKFLHRAQSRVTVRDRTGRLYDAYMLDISRYVGERTRRNLDILAFWESNDVLRRTRLIYLERPYSYCVTRVVACFEYFFERSKDIATGL